MRPVRLMCAILAGWAVISPLRGAEVSNRVAYTLLEGSYLLDECLICGRPTIEQPLRGTFDLTLIQDTAPYIAYAVENIDWIASQGSTLERRITGDGAYTRFEEF